MATLWNSTTESSKQLLSFPSANVKASKVWRQTENSVCFECTWIRGSDRKIKWNVHGLQGKNKKEKKSAKSVLCFSTKSQMLLCFFFSSHRVLSFSVSALFPLGLKQVTPHNVKSASHYRVLNLRTQSHSWPWAWGRNLYMTFSEVQRSLFCLWEALAVVGWWALVRRSAADVVVIKGLVALMIWRGCSHCVAIER